MSTTNATFIEKDEVARVDTFAFFGAFRGIVFVHLLCCIVTRECLIDVKETSAEHKPAECAFLSFFREK